jgi:hypothetical protein
MAGIMFTDNNFGTFDTDTREYITWALEGEQTGFYPDAFGVLEVYEGGIETIGHGPFATLSEAEEAAWAIYDEGYGATVEVTTPDGQSFGVGILSA